MWARGITEFSPKYKRYTPEATSALMRISEALGAIQGARVLPAVADQLRASARVGTIHYSNLIEGNELPVVEAERAARGELAGDSKAKIELVNYVQALDLIDRKLAKGDVALAPDFLLELHKATTQGVGRDDHPHFKPHHEGTWRDGVAFVVDNLTGQVMHEGPPADEVDARMLSMFEWLNKKLALGEPPFVIAGAVHYGITDVHPFADGNGRVARLFQVALLMFTGKLPGRMFSFERYYAEDRAAYYGALRSVTERTGNMERWLAYFLRGLAEEYERVSATVADLSALMPGSKSLQLNTTQERGLVALRVEGRREFTRRDYEQAARVRRSTAGQDLAALVGHGFLRTLGQGPSTRYAFPSPNGTAGRTTERRGRPQKWTEALIEEELRAFVGRSAEWPTAAEFKAADKGGLHAAVTRAGGIKRWRRHLGY